ncbi:endonuclease/exonuclease/phosphatase family protein [Streptomyces sp. ISL-100]|uniref:endonuclease/exonuclease/phosphatase family protein n=1 Tax=Streptomyces sp. ISL-100 TaxID=2819173 RepID=UPI001BE8B1F0|nr:endonuclease/exonuclease/phosphatase family protein [Streptomyces sp. ISL-100]MBT2398825.1 endonuclease/exonuclease/phosphatase family protein [Streptomyces sp. ISL-100]
MSKITLHRATAAAVLTLTTVLTGPASAAQVAPRAQTLKVMTFNTWHGGNRVDDGITKIANEITKAGADVVALQEYDADSAQRIADRLGWYTTATGTHVDIVSRFPFEKQDRTGTGNGVIAAKIKGFWVYSVHFDYTKYGPYNACWDNDSYPTIYADEANRGKQAKEVVTWAGSSPAIVAGDFNSPSHLDWTADTKAAHCNSVVEWPATKAFWDGGYWDSYREVHPDEAAQPGNTWSPVVKSTDGRPEPQDRIDFIQYKGGTLDAVASTTVGGGADWPSDHLAVLTTFTY